MRRNVVWVVGVAIGCTSGWAPPAAAGEMLLKGDVYPLYGPNEVVPVLGMAAFDEGPVTGPVPLDQYAALGLTFRTGLLSAMLSGVTTPGSCDVAPYYAVDAASFPSPILGGGIASGSQMASGGCATLSVPVHRVGLTASSQTSAFLTVWASDGTMIGQAAWIPTGDAAFIGLESNTPIALLCYGTNDLYPEGSGTFDQGAAPLYSDTWLWAGGSPGQCTQDAQCDDVNECTIDLCEPNLGCRHSNVEGTSCGDECMGTGSCSDGWCVTDWGPADCDLFVCNSGCDPATGCIPISGCCDDIEGPPCEEGLTCDVATNTCVPGGGGSGGGSATSPSTDDEGGCGCRVLRAAPSEPRQLTTRLLAFALALVAMRRRRSSCRAKSTLRHIGRSGVPPK